MAHRTSRRQFLQATAAASIGLSGAAGLAARESGASGESVSAGAGEGLKASSLARQYWIDPGIAAWAPGPWRKVHIEYHTSRHMPRLAERFNADEFGDQLRAAHVNGATVFAKDMYGFSYFPSKHGRMHPNLSFDLLGAQVAALRKREIQVLAYYMLTWNPELADRHPEWLVVHEPGAKPREASEEQKAFMNTLKPDGAKPAKPPGEEKGYRPYLWQFCIAQEAFVQGELDLLEELVARYELDGVWLDGGSSPPCYCPECVRQLKAKGLDPFDAGVQYTHKWELYLSFLERIGQVVKKARPGCLVCPQNQGTFYGLAKRTRLFDYSSQEALFTDAPHYGYHYWPTVIRYARGFGRPFHGCTVIFKDFWADFGGLKTPAQMHTEVAAFVAQGARCDIGDQVPPDGRLDPAVYHVIGQGYYNQGFWIYRRAFHQALTEVLPAPLLETDAHLTTELSLTHQAARLDGRPERHLVHLVSYSPVRRTPKHTDFHDDPIPLSNVMVRVNLPLKVSQATALYAGQDLPVRRTATGGVEVVVPRVHIHEVVCFTVTSTEPGY